MKAKLDKKRIPGLIVIFLSVFAVFALLWGAVSLIAKLTNYGKTATVGAEADPETEQENEQTAENSGSTQQTSEGLIPGLALCEYDAHSFYEKDGFVLYAGDRQTATGVDVSSHQQEIDWAAVAADGVDFAMIRVGYRGYTEGEIMLDDYFIRNMDGALAAGLDVGVYFFSQAVSEQEAKEEADFVLTWVKGYELAYPIIFDWEDIEAEARTDGMDQTTLTACAKAFCEDVKQAGYTPGIYFNQRFGYQELNLLQLQDYTFWLAEYNLPPTFVYDYRLWQYTNAGTVDGIAGNVDLNLCFLPKT